MTNIDAEQIKAELHQQFPELKQLKPNPNHFPIIDKWNTKIFQRNKFGLFDYINTLVDKMVEAKISEIF